MKIQTLLMLLILSMFTFSSSAAHAEADITRVGAGEQHTIFLSESGSSTLVIGRNQFGQLGTGTTVDSLSPQRLLGLNGKMLVQAAAGNDFSAFLTSNGDVYTSGNNQYGQLGREIVISDQQITSELTNLLAEPFADVLEDAFKNEASHTLEGLMSQLSETNRTIAYNQWEKTKLQYNALQLLDQENTNDLNLILRRDKNFKREVEAYVLMKKRTTPAPVNTDAEKATFTNVTAIAAGAHHVLALKDDGTVWAWGYNSDGQLGIHTTENATAPTKINYLKDIKQIHANDSHSLALTEDGHIWAWGENWSGILGTDHHRSNAPVKISDITNIELLSTGKNHLLLLKKDGTVWTVNIANINESNLKIEPSRIPNLSNIVQIAAGDDYNLALKNDSTVWAWGKNNDGQLGDGTTESKKDVIQITEIPPAKAIFAGRNTSFAITEDNDLYSWGSNQYGKLGIEEKEYVTIPEKISIVSIKEIAAYPKQMTLQKGAVTSVHVSVNPLDAPIDSIRWESSNRWIVDVDNDGRITACNYCQGGKAVLTVTVNELFQDQVTVEVTAEKEISSLDIAIGEQKTRINSNRIWWLGVGERINLNANIAPYDANKDSIIWTSSDPLSVAVEPTGQSSTMKGLTPGKVTIAATSLYEDDKLQEVEDSFEVKTYIWQEWDTQTSQDIRKAWEISFNDRLQSSTVNSETVYILDKNGKRVKTHAMLNGSEIKVIPSESFNYGEYTLYISKNIQSSSNNHVLKKGIKMPFKIIK
jgi:alpha-tubulin suppressor-like RCC1 family protein